VVRLEARGFLEQADRVVEALLVEALRGQVEARLELRGRSRDGLLPASLVAATTTTPGAVNMPEPGMLAPLGLGFGLLAGLRRRRRSDQRLPSSGCRFRFRLP
jgi:hypothetical protein